MNSGRPFRDGEAAGLDDRFFAGKLRAILVAGQPGQLHQSRPVVEVGDGSIPAPGNACRFRVEEKEHGGSAFLAGANALNDEDQPGWKPCRCPLPDIISLKEEYCSEPEM